MPSALVSSTDGGENWKWADPGCEIRPVVSLAFDPISPTVVYAGTTGELLKSADEGVTWQSLRQDLGSSAIAMEPGGAHCLFVLAGGIWRSSDGGQTWELLPYPPANVQDLLFVLVNPPILYAATTRGLYRSTDGAQTWQRAAG